MALDLHASRRVLIDLPDGTQPQWVRALRRFSEAGSYGIGWIALFAVVVTWREGITAAAVAAACVVGTLATNTVIKQVVRRRRPRVNAAGQQPSTYSMPSAHTSMAVVGAAVMCTVVPQLAALWVAVAVALAVSRVMLGMHYIADIVVGALYGLAIAVVAAVPSMHAVH